MASRRIIPTIFSLAILLSMLIATLPAGNRVGATPFVAIIVYDHGLAKQILYVAGGHVVPVNKTSSFSQDDPFVYAYFTAAVSSANVTWLWYDPDGQLYLNQTQQISCDRSPCTFVYDFRVGYSTAATMLGPWTLTLQAGGVDLYSDHFSITPNVNQDDFWKFDIIGSEPPRVHVGLTVTIHPHNQTWSSYLIRMSDACNVTAYDPATNRTLVVTVSNSTNQILVNLGAARSDGYKFVISFDLLWYDLSPLRDSSGWDSGYFGLRWQESSWWTFGDGIHPVPGSFEITLPRGASLMDAVGVNDLAFNQNTTVGLRPTVFFVTTLSPGQTFGWVILYRDPTYSTANPQPSSNPVGGGLIVAQAQPIPILPLTVGSLSIWSAVMSVLLLTGSELLSPVYARTGVVINRRRLRIAALVLVAIFLAASAYQIISLSQPVTVVGP